MSVDAGAAGFAEEAAAMIVRLVLVAVECYVSRGTMAICVVQLKFVSMVDALPDVSFDADNLFDLFCGRGLVRTRSDAHNVI